MSTVVMQPDVLTSETLAYIRFILIDISHGGFRLFHVLCLMSLEPPSGTVLFDLEVPANVV